MKLKKKIHVVSYIMGMFLVLSLLSNRAAYGYGWQTCEGRAITWDSNPHTMYVSTISFPDGDPLTNALHRAMDAWNNVQGTYSRFAWDRDSEPTHGITNGLNEIAFEDGTYLSGALAVTRLDNTDCFWFFGWQYGIREADIVFNNQYLWSGGPFTLGNLGSPYKLELVALHELGHAHGLNHEDRALATMNSVYPNSGGFGLNNQITPWGDDRNGVRFLYQDGSTTEVDVAASALKRTTPGNSSWVFFDRVGTAGSLVNMEYSISNLSTSTVSFNIGYYLSSDNNITTSDILIGTGRAVDWQPGAVGTFSSNFFIPSWVNAGTYYLGFIVNYDNAVAETNTSNNAQAMPFPIQINRSNFRLTVTKAGTGSGGVTSTPAGINCPSSCFSTSNTFNTGSTVTLTATPSSGSIFAGWTGNNGCSSGQVIMNMDLSCTAVFNQAPQQTFNLFLSKTGSGIGTVSTNPVNINCQPSCSSSAGAFNSGTMVTLIATPVTGSTFVGWSGDPGCSAGQVTMTVEKRCTATFNQIPPSNSVLFSDDFARTTGLGSDWTVYSGVFNTDGSYAVTAGGAGRWAGINKPLSTNDYLIETTMVVPAGSHYSGIIVRGNATDISAGGYAAQLDTNGKVNLYRRDGTVWTLLQSYTVTGGITAGTPYKLALTVTGSNPVALQVIFQGSRLFTYSDSSGNRITSGIPGIQTYDPNVKYDYFHVKNAASFSDSPPVASNILFLDNFDRTNGMDLNWQVYYGAFNTDGTYAISAGNPGIGEWAGILTPLSTDDYAIESAVTIPAGSHFSGIIARGNLTDLSTSGYVAQLDTNGTVNLYRRDPGGIWTLLQSYTVPGGIAAGTPYTLKLDVSGSATVVLNVYFQGNLVVNGYIDSTSSRLITGIPGIETYDPNVKYDYVKILGH